MTKLTNEQIRICTVMLLNLFFGMLLITSYYSYQEIFSNGLWHKVLFYPFYIPIGAITIAILSAILAYGTICFILFDYRVIKNGLQYIEVKDEKKSATIGEPIHKTLEPIESG